MIDEIAKEKLEKIVNAAWCYTSGRFLNQMEIAHALKIIIEYGIYVEGCDYKVYVDTHDDIFTIKIDDLEFKCERRGVEHG